MTAADTASTRLGRLRSALAESPPLLWSFAYFFCLLSGYYVLRPVREAMAEGRERFREMRAWRGGWHDDDRGERGDRGGRRHWRDRDDQHDD